MSYISEEEFISCCEEFLVVSNSIEDTWTKEGQVSHSCYLVKREIRTLEPRHLKFRSTGQSCDVAVASHAANCAGDASRCEQFCDRGCEADNPRLKCQAAYLQLNEGEGARVEPDDFFPEFENDSSGQYSTEDPSEFQFDLKTKKETVTFEYNIMYSLSHSVPMLTFEAYWANGKPLTLEETWHNVVDSNFIGQIYRNRWESLTMVEHPVKGSPCFTLHPCKTAHLMDQVEKISLEPSTDQEQVPPSRKDAFVYERERNCADMKSKVPKFDKTDNNSIEDEILNSSCRNFEKTIARRQIQDVKNDVHFLALSHDADDFSQPQNSRTTADSDRTFEEWQDVKSFMNVPQETTKDAPGSMNPLHPRTRRSENLPCSTTTQVDDFATEGVTMNESSAHSSVETASPSCEAKDGQLRDSSARNGKLRGAKYLISWLSMMGPVVGLKLDLRYFSHE